MTAKAVQRRLGEQREAALRRLSGACILGDVESEPVLRDEEGVDGPIAAVALVPDAASILEFDERLKVARALVARTQRLARHARQVEDRYDARLDRDVFEHAVDHAAKPDGRACALGGVVGAEHEQVPRETAA